MFYDGFAPAIVLRIHKEVVPDLTIFQLYSSASNNLYFRFWMLIFSGANNARHCFFLSLGDRVANWPHHRGSKPLIPYSALRVKLECPFSILAVPSTSSWWCLLLVMQPHQESGLVAGWWPMVNRDVSLEVSFWEHKCLLFWWNAQCHLLGNL